MTEIFERPGVIDAKTYETSLSVEKGVFRRRQIPDDAAVEQFGGDGVAAVFQ